MALYELQQKVTEFDKRFGWVGDKPEHTALHMQEEVGEIAREILKSAKYKSGKYDPQDLNNEITDLIYLTLKLGNLMSLNLDEGWERIGKRYEGK
jgi:NTP pyrophosphatase (non-canonical NTP hydrolase)